MKTDKRKEKINLHLLTNENEYKMKTKNESELKTKNEND
jgi:hypothetical protein